MMFEGRFFSGLPFFLACPSPSADKPSDVTARKQAHPTKRDDFFIHSAHFVLCQCDYFVIHHRWDLEAYCPVTLLEWQRTPGAQRPHAADFLLGGDVEFDLLRADGVKAADESARHIRVVVIHDM